ncbi:MAG TPA: hypothetical protein VFC78_21925 [Tepidisphaeraceae bacterium]|nr:hypothetical protein [Tepidisphaeraceae bacterium]
MLKLNPEYLSRNGQRQFVILTIEDFSRLTDALEDAQDLRILRQARDKNKGKPTFTLAQVKRQLAVGPSRKAASTKRTPSRPPRTPAAANRRP